MEKHILTDGPCSLWDKGIEIWYDGFGRRVEKIGNRAVIYSAKVRFPQHEGDPEVIIVEGSLPGHHPSMDFVLLSMGFYEGGRGCSWPTRDRSGSWMKYS